MVGLRFPAPMLALIDEESAKFGINRSRLIRAAVMAWLRSRGHTGFEDELLPTDCR